jgi:hypothetical protein
MLNKEGKSDLWRRIRLYLFGVVMGLIGCYFIFGSRGLKSLTPGMLKLDQLATKDSVQYSDTALCEMKCQHITKDEVVESFTYGKIDSKKSQDFRQRYPLYNFKGQIKRGDTLNIICMERDSIVRIIYVRDLALKDTCKCR